VNRFSGEPSRRALCVSQQQHLFSHRKLHAFLSNAWVATTARWRHGTLSAILAGT
jgi:hypothetical protein